MSITQEKTKLNLARIKKFGKTFEISIDPDAAVKYRKGEISNISEALLVDGIFMDAKKGLHATNDDLNAVFKTTDVYKIAHIILTEGEIQATSGQRAEERDLKRKKLIHLIHQQAVDPQTKYPHPVTRIEAALEEGKITLDDHKSIEEQFEDIIAKLRPIIPISIEKKEIIITIPSQYTGKSQQLVRNNKIIKEDWKADGSWQVTVELPAGMVPELIDQLNSLTKGEVVVGDQ